MATFQIEEYEPGEHRVNNWVLNPNIHQIQTIDDRVGIYDNGRTKYVVPLTIFSDWIDPAGSPYASEALLISDLNNFFFDTVDVGTLVFPYKADINNIMPPPSDRFLQWNDAVQQNATQIFVSIFNDAFQNIENLLLLIKPNDRIIIFDSSDSNKYQDWRVTLITDSSGYITYNVELLESTTTFTINNQKVTLTLLVSSAFSEYGAQGQLPSQVSTTSLVSVNVHTVNFTPHKPGKFKLHYFILWTLNSISQAAILEICLNGVVLFSYRMEPSDMDNRDIINVTHDADLIEGNNVLEWRFFKSGGNQPLIVEEAEISAMRLPP